MAEYTRKQLHKILKDVRDRVKHGNQTSHGICNNMDKLASYSYADVRKYWQKWPEFSGVDAFPVPDPEHMHPNDIKIWASRTYLASARTAIWTGKYGESRMRLLNYLIRQTR